MLTKAGTATPNLTKLELELELYYVTASFPLCMASFYEKSLLSLVLPLNLEERSRCDQRGPKRASVSATR